MALAYSHECFAALPSLGEAQDAFHATEARAHLEGPVRQLFLDHKVEGRYGVALLHRHFSIQPTQRLVEYHRTATAWNASNVTSDIFPKYDGFIAPRSYLFDEEGTLRPYEFDFHSNEEGPVGAPSSGGEFFSALYALLCQYSLAKVLGIRDLKGYDSTLSVEVTEDSANIMLPSTAVSPADSLIEAMWTFNGDSAIQCVTKCVPSGSDGNHKRVHIN